MALNYSIFEKQYLKSNPTASKSQVEGAFKKQPGGAEYLSKTIAKNQTLAKTNQQNAQQQYLNSGGTLKPGEVYDPYASLQKASQTGTPIQKTLTQQEADKARENVGGIANYKTPVSQQPNYGKNSYQTPTSNDPEYNQGDNYDYGGDSEDPFQSQLDKQKELTEKYKAESAEQKKTLGTISGQVNDFASQLNDQQSQVQDLVNSLNSKQQGLGDTVNSVLQEMAQSGVQANLTPETFQMIQDMALDTPADEIDDKIMQMSESQPVEPPPPQDVPMEAPLPTELPLPPAQQYQSLKQSGLNAGQIIQQDPKMMNQIVPDGSIIDPNMGVGIIQTPLGEAYKTPSGLVIPKDPSTGFMNLGALSPEQIKKLSFADVMAVDLSTQKTASDLKAFYNATTFQQMAQRNDREYGIAEIDLQAFYNAETNRVNESQVKAMQTLEIEKLRQDLSKDTSLKQLNEAKSKTANIMKAQMDAWGLEGSSTVLAAMSAHSLKFEQAASSITQSYDLNIKELAMASTQTQMEFTNRVTEMNQKMQVQKMGLKNDWLNKKDDIDKSVLLSKIEQTTEQQNMYRDYVGKIYDHEQEVQAAAAAAAKEAQAEIWEKQKYYSEQMGMLVSVGSDGSINPMLSEDGTPIETMEGKKFSLEGMKFEWEQEKYSTDYDLRVAQFEQDQYEFGIDADLRQQTFDQNVQEFGMTYALQQDKQAFDQYASERDFGLDVSKFNQADEQFYASMKGFDMKQNENGDYVGTNKNGEVVNFGQPPTAAMPLKSKFEFNPISPNEVRFNVAAGTALDRYQCGAFANDALFGEAGHFGDSIEVDIKNLGNSSVPVAGGAFMERTGTTAGHKGVVEKVNYNPDGSIASFEIRESNVKKNDKGQSIVSTATIYPGDKRWGRIVDNGAFYDPVKGGSSNFKKGKGVTGDGPYAKFIQEQVKSGMSQTDAIELANKKMEKGEIGSSDNQVMALDNALTALEDLKTASGKSGAVGAGWQKIFRGKDDSGAPKFRDGSGPAGFKAKFDTLMSTLTIPQLGTLKGPMSDKDIAFLKAASTSLSLNTSEKQFDETLDKMIAAYKRLQQDAKNQGTSLEDLPKDDYSPFPEEDPKKKISFNINGL